MKFIPKKQSIERKNSPICIVTEYDLGDKELDFAIARIAERNPDSNRVMKTICKEVVYVHSGNGKVVVNEKEYSLQAGDVVLIDSGEKFY